MARRSHSAFLYSLALALLFALVCGQSSSPPSPPSQSPAPSPSPQTFIVDVGKGDHTFKPEVVQANVGDIVEFHFFPANHSVVRAEYGHPCIPYELTGKGKVGFFSGFHPVDAIYTDPPKWQVRINDTDPIFYYCSAVGSCINYGMVGVINPNASVSLKTQQEKARQAKYMLNPGESFPDEQGPSSVGYTASSTAKPPSTASTAAASTTTTASASASSSHGLSAGAIAGIAIGGAAVLVLAAALFFFMGRTKKLEDTLQRNSMAFGATHSGGGGPFNSSMGTYQRDSGSLVVPGANNRISQLTASTYDTTPVHKPPETIVETVSPRSAAGSPPPVPPTADISGVYFSAPTGTDGTAPHQPSTGPHEMYAPASHQPQPQMHGSHPAENFTDKREIS